MSESWALILIWQSSFKTLVIFTGFWASDQCGPLKTPAAIRKLDSVLNAHGTKIIFVMPNDDNLNVMDSEKAKETKESAQLHG